MAQQKPKGQSQSAHNTEGITRITVGGFKSISNDQSIEIRPLTILAGANSSGKSSIMQPLLLLKQTLEAPYDPGALLLNGPNVQFTLADQLLSRTSNGKIVDTFHVDIELETEETLATYLKRSKNKGLDVEQTVNGFSKEVYRLYKGMPKDEIDHAALSALFGILKNDTTRLSSDVFLARNRCFLTLAIRRSDESIFFTPIHSEVQVGRCIRQIIHLPGLRGNPGRTYPVTAVNSEFPGTFEPYVASVIGQWQLEGDENTLEKVNYDLIRLGLTGKVAAKPLDDTQVELLVNRFLHNNAESAEDMVSIADVGFGVSQALPVVVALHIANPGQLIYIEQPEIHLHPRAQSLMAEVLADAAIAGKRLVVETHSSLLLLGIQTLVAEKKLSPELVKLHWFTQQEDGSTQITSADLDEAGAYGDWPEDFANVELNSESRYLDAAEARLRGK